MIAVSRLSNHTVQRTDEGLTLSFSQQIDLTNEELSEEIAKYEPEEIIGLDLSYCFDINDISCVSRLSKLKSLDISYSGVEDISALEGLEGLQSLTMNGLAIEDISTVSSLHSLTGLYFANTNVSSIDALSGLSELKYLSMD